MAVLRYLAQCISVMSQPPLCSYIKRNLLIVPVVLLLMIGLLGWRTWRTVRQDRLNERLFLALRNNDADQAIAALDAGADPGARYRLAIRRFEIWEYLRGDYSPRLRCTALIEAVD